MKRIIICSAVLGKVEAVPKNICIRKISKNNNNKKKFIQIFFYKKSKK